MFVRTQPRVCRHQDKSHHQNRYQIIISVGDQLLDGTHSGANFSKVYVCHFRKNSLLWVKDRSSVEINLKKTKFSTAILQLTQFLARKRRKYWFRELKIFYTKVLFPYYDNTVHNLVFAVTEHILNNLFLNANLALVQRKEEISTNNSRLGWQHKVESACT